jgi:tetratricopeptide (TPR) repeat protein
MSEKEQLPVELKLKSPDIYLTPQDSLTRKVVDAIVSKRGIAVVTGPAGSGKTTLLARCAAELSEKGFTFALIRGRTEPEIILKELLLKARDLGNVEAEQLFLSAADMEAKWNWLLENYLEQERVVLVLDSFEENLTDTGDFFNPQMKAILSMLAVRLKKKPSFVLVSSELDIEDFDSIEVGSLSRREFVDGLGRLEHLPSICEGQEEILYKEIGGNPLVIKLLDALARFEKKKSSGADLTWDMLKDAVPGLKLALARTRQRCRQLIRLFAGRLLSHLNSGQMSLLVILAAYRFPVGKSALAVHQMEVSEDLQNSCLESGFMEFDPELERYSLHPAVADVVLAEMDVEERKQLHERCGRFFMNLQDPRGNKSMDDILEARRHFMEAEEWDAAAEATFSLGDYLGSIGFLDFSYQLLVEVGGKQLNTKNRAAADYSMGNLYARYGRLTEAGESLANALKSWELDEAKDNIPLALQQIGYVRSLEQKFDEALDFYNQALAFYQDPAKGLEQARLEHQIAIILKAKGEGEEALKLFQQSVEVMEKSGDEANVAASYLQMGQIFLTLENTDAAVEHFEHSLDICRGMGDRSGIGVRYYFIGQAYEAAGNSSDGLRSYAKAWQEFSRLGSADEAEVRHHIVRLRDTLSGEEFSSIMEECRCDASQFDTQRMEQEEFLELMRVMTQNAVYFGKLPEAERGRTIELLNNMISSADFDGAGMGAFKIYFQMLLAYIYHEDYQRFRPLLPAEMWAFFQRALAGYH